jgi:hypothetical protein
MIRLGARPLARKIATAEGALVSKYVWMNANYSVRALAIVSAKRMPFTNAAAKSTMFVAQKTRRTMWMNSAVQNSGHIMTATIKRITRLRTSYLASVFLAIAGLCGITATGCKFRACGLQEVAGVSITVVDGAAEQVGHGGAGGGSNSNACRATITAVSSSGHTQQLSCGASAQHCWCKGLYEQTGTYQLTVELDGQTENKTVTIEKEDKCHVKTEYVCFFGECPDDEAP